MKPFYEYKRLKLNFIFILLFIPLMFISVYFVPFFFLLISNFFDVLGYYFVLTRKGAEYPDKEIRTSYRIIQFLFDIITLFLLGVYFGITPALSGAVMKMTGAQDLLYYLFLKKDLPDKWTWMTFTPYGFIKKTILKKEVIIQAIMGVILAMLLFYFIKL